MLRASLYFLALAAAGWLCVGAQAQPAPTVLILNQGGPDLLSFADIAMNVRSVVNRRANRTTTVYIESLDLNRFGGPAYQTIQQEFLRAKYKDISIGVIVAMGRHALDYALAYRAAVSPDIPIVFTAVATQAIDLATLPPNVTGNTLDVSIRNALIAAKAVVPDLKRIVLVGDELDRQSFRFHFVDELPAIREQTEIIDLLGLPMPELKERVSRLSAESAIYYTTINIDGDGKAFLPTEALEKVARAANRPIIVDSGVQVGRGATGGFAVDTRHLGIAAGELAARILAGTPASAIPVTETNGLRPVFDWRQLQRWNVDESRLPQGSELRFRDLTIWERYPERVLGAVLICVLQSVLIAGLILSNRRRRAAEADKQLLLGELMHVNRFATAGELTASIAHEVRQPLSAILASADAGSVLLKAKDPDLKEVRSALLEVSKEGRRADDVIKSILAIFRNNAPPHVAVDLNLNIEQVLALCDQKFVSERVEVVRRLAEPAPIVRGDAVQLQQLFLNLTMNAVDAMSGQAAARILTVETGVDGDHCFASFHDSGPGIDSELAKTIFRPLVTGKSGGIGLGLAICKRIVDAHGGEIRVERRNTSGTSFQVTLPVAG